MELPPGYFSVERYYNYMLKESGRKPTDKVPGYTCTYIEMKKMLESGIIDINCESNKKFYIHGEWDDPSYSKNERILAYKIFLLEEKIDKVIKNFT